MTPPIGLNSTIKRVENLVSCDLDGETALMSVENGKYYAMNHLGSRIWVLLEQARFVSAICSLLVEEFEVQPSKCEDEVLAFLNELSQDNLVKVVDESTT